MLRLKLPAQLEPGLALESKSFRVTETVILVLLFTFSNLTKFVVNVSGYEESFPAVSKGCSLLTSKGVPLYSYTYTLLEAVIDADVDEVTFVKALFVPAVAEIIFQSGVS